MHLGQKATERLKVVGVYTVKKTRQGTPLSLALTSIGITTARLVEMVKTDAFHAEDGGFESHTGYQMNDW